MKKIYLLLYIILSFNVYSQNNLYSIEYQFEANLDYSIQSIDQLYYDPQKKISYYKNGNLKTIGETYKAKNANEIVINQESENSDFVYIDINNDLIYNQITPISNTYLTTEKIPFFNWNILKETKTINDIELTKATTSFRGRIYEVWFSYEYPISIGPWKFNGLPGLIFEVIDKSTTYNYSWKLKTLKQSKAVLPFTKSLNRNLINLNNFIAKHKEEFFDNEKSLFLKIGLEATPPSNNDLEKMYQQSLSKEIEKKHEWEE